MVVFAIVLQAIVFVVTLVTAIVLALCGYDAAEIVAVISAASAASLALTLPFAGGGTLKKRIAKVFDRVGP